MKNLLIIAIITLLSMVATSMEQDVDECYLNPCHYLASCTNTNGSFICYCLPAYSGNGTYCEDLDECEYDYCGEYATCINTDGSYYCVCDEGYTGDGQYCIPLCEPECGEYEYCRRDYDDDYDYYGDYDYECVCNYGFTGGAGNCTDIDECAQYYDCIEEYGEDFDYCYNVCGENEVCTNTIGSNNCTCVEGYNRNYYTYDCIPVNASCPEDCGINENCSAYTNYECECQDGYTDEYTTYCEDINECERDYCDYVKDSYCYNTDGSYECVCEEGYYRSYVIDQCIPIDGDVFRYEASVFKDPDGCDPSVNQYRRDDIMYTIQRLISEYLCVEEKEDETGE